MGYTITPTELKSRLDKGDQLVLLDVREPWEFDLAKLNGSTLIPLATLPQSLGKLNRETEIVAILGRGYSILMRARDGTILRSALDVEVDEELVARLAQGELDCTVKRVVPDPLV